MSRLAAFLLFLFLTLALIKTFSSEELNLVNKQEHAITSPDGSRVTVVQKYKPVTLDPTSAADTGSSRVIANIFEGLTRFKPGTALVEPCLASSWEVSDDGLEWTFHLRKGVLFHDGTTFNAIAVEQNVKRLQKLAKNKTASYADVVTAPLDSVEVQDNYTIVFHLKYSYAPLLNNLAMPMAAPMVSPATFQKQQQDKLIAPAGTGPYIPSSQTGDGILLRANNKYWGPKPEAGEILFLFQKNMGRRVQMLLDGRADIALDLNFAETSDLKLQGYPVFRATGLDMCYIGFYTDKKPFNRTQLRNAVALTINKESIFNELWFNEVRPAINTLPPTVPGFTGGGGSPAYNLQKAVNLLKGAGYGDGMSFTLLTFTDPRSYCPEGGKVLAEKVSLSLAKAGFKVNVVAYPWDEFKRALVRREGDAFIFGWTSDNGDPDNFLYTLLAGSQIDGGMNVTRYHNPLLDTLLVSARNTTDPEIRRELYERALEAINQDSPLIVLDHSQYHAATSPRIKGFVLSPTGWDTYNGINKLP